MKYIVYLFHIIYQYLEKHIVESHRQLNTKRETKQNLQILIKCKINYLQVKVQYIFHSFVTFNVRYGLENYFFGSAISNILLSLIHIEVSLGGKT